MILGVDPGIRKLGYALIDQDLTIIDAGVLLQDTKAPTRYDYFYKMSQIQVFFKHMIEEHSITGIGMEKLYFTSANQANAEFVYGVRAMIWLLALEQGIEVVERTPNEVKKYITGNGKASKELVEQFTMKLFRMQHRPEYYDTSDALGIAYLTNNTIKRKNPKKS